MILELGVARTARGVGLCVRGCSRSSGEGPSRWTTVTGGAPSTSAVAFDEMRVARGGSGAEGDGTVFSYIAIPPQAGTRAEVPGDGLVDGTAGYGLLGRLVAMPWRPAPDEPVRLRCGPGVALIGGARRPGGDAPGCIGSGAGLNAQPWRGVVAWGRVDHQSGWWYPSDGPPPDAELRDSVSILRAALERSLGPSGGGPVEHLCFAALPAVAVGGFAGSGLAVPGGDVLVLPRNHKEMDAIGRLWIAAHELAHQWVGVGVPAVGTEVEDLVEGMCAYLALAALCRGGFADRGDFQRLVELSVARVMSARTDGSRPPGMVTSLPMHAAFLRLLRTDARLRLAGLTPLLGRLRQHLRRARAQDLALTDEIARELLETDEPAPDRTHRMITELRPFLCRRGRVLADWGPALDSFFAEA